MNIKIKPLFFNIGFSLLVLAFLMTFWSNGFGHHESPFMSVIYVVIFLGGALTIFFDTRNKKELIGHSFLVYFFLLYSCWLFIAPYFSTWFDVSRLVTWILFLTPLGFFTSSFLTPTALQKKIILIVYLGFGMFLFVWSILHIIVTRQKPNGPLLDANVYAGLLLFFLVPVIVYWLVMHRDNKINAKIHDYLFLYIIFGFGAFFAAYSRSATGALLLVGSFLLLKIFRDHNGFSLKRILLLLLVIVVTFSASRPIQYNSFARDLSTDTSFQARVGMWESSLEAYKDNNPIVGIGFGQYVEFYTRYRNSAEKVSTGEHAHNDYIEFLLEGGIVQAVFIIILSFWIIFNYFRLLLLGKSTLGKDTSLKVFLAMSLCCIFFIQASVNFIFYVTTNALLIGLLLGYVNRYGFKTNKHYALTKKNGVALFSVSLFTLAMMLLTLFTAQYFYFLPSDLSDDEYESLFETSKRMEIVMPRSMSLPHFNIKYKLQEMSSKESLPTDEQLIYVNSELKRAVRNKKYDPDTVRYLAKYANEDPEIFQIFADRFPNQELFQMNAEELFLLSINYDPLLLASYFTLREIYIKKDEIEKSYRLNAKLYLRPDIMLISKYYQMQILEMLLDDSVLLGYGEDAENYANIYINLGACHEKAYEILAIDLPEKCLK